MNNISVDRRKLTEYLLFARRAAGSPGWTVHQVVAALREERRVRAIELAAAGATAQELWCGGYSVAEISFAAKVIAEDVRLQWHVYDATLHQVHEAEFELDMLIQSLQLVA